MILGRLPRTQRRTVWEWCVDGGWIIHNGDPSNGRASMVMARTAWEVIRRRSDVISLRLFNHGFPRACAETPPRRLPDCVDDRSPARLSGSSDAH
jgi:hypothetical protein